MQGLGERNLRLEMFDGLLGPHTPIIGAPILKVNRPSDIGSPYAADLMEAGTFGGRVRGLRKALGLRQTVLAKRAKISQSALSDIENDVTTPKDVKAPTLAGLAKALGTNPGYLVSGKDTPVAPEVLTVEEAELVAIYRELARAGKGGALLGAGRGMLEHADQKPSKTRPYAKVRA